jgi:hypothetical protein
MSDHTIHMGMAPTFSEGMLDYSNPIIPTIVKIDESQKYLIQRFDGADPLHLFEANSAIYWHKLLTRDRIVSEQDLVKIIRATESIIPVSYLPSNFEYKSNADDVALYAAITSMTDQFLLVSTRELILPEAFVKWMHVASSLVDRFIWMKHLQRGLHLIDAFRRGLLPAILIEHLASGMKWKEDYQGRPKSPPTIIK